MYILSFFKKGDTIQGGHYLRKYGMHLVEKTIINKSCQGVKTLIFKVIFQCGKLIESFKKNSLKIRRPTFDYFFFENFDF